MCLLGTQAILHPSGCWDTGVEQAYNREDIKIRKYVKREEIMFERKTL